MPRQAKAQDDPPPKYAIFEDWSEGMNTQAARQGLSEKAGAWIENVQPIAANQLQGVPAPMPSLVTLAANAVKQFDAVIGAQDYSINFCSDGSAYALPVSGAAGAPAVATGPALTIGTAGTFSKTGGDVANWNGQRILIADSVSGYATWDGTLFVRSGSVSPNFQVTAGGSLYASGATAAITGGSGSGATASVQTVGGVVTGLTLTNPGMGYAGGDTLTVTISPVAGGSGATANGHVWPFVTPAPTTVATAFGRVWMANARVMINTGTGSSTFGQGFDDFSSADGSVTTTIADADLVHSVTALRFLEGFLYILGDNSVKFVGSISGSNFTITPLSSDQGTSFPQSVVSFNRLVIFANITGVFAVFGASVEKISGQMDGIFKFSDFSLPIQCAVNDINNVHTLLVLVRYLDPVKGTRALMMAYFNSKWYVISQGNGIVAISTMILGGHSDTFASSGTDVTQLLQSTMTPLAYMLQTSLTHRRDPIHSKRITRIGIAEEVNGTSDLQLTADSELGSQSANLAPQSAVINIYNNAGVQLTVTNNALVPVKIDGSGFVLKHSGTLNNTGRFIGSTVTGTTNGIAIKGVYVEYQEADIIMGDTP